MRAVVTGAGGFIGSHLVPALSDAGWQVTAVRRGTVDQLSGADVVFHLAGLAHGGAQAAQETRLQQVNATDSLALYRQAVACGVPLFVWLSSIKVLGEVSERPLTNQDQPAPQDAYGRSKAAGERLLRNEPAGSTRLAIVRPPLVYGPGVKANFLRLLRMAGSRWPAPLGSATARRAMVSVENLVSLLLRVAEQSENAAGIWHVRDAQEVSVREIYCTLVRHFGRSPRLLPVPPRAAIALAGLVGQQASVQRLFCPLRVDMRATAEHFDWRPPFDQEDELMKVTQWYLRR